MVSYLVFVKLYAPKKYSNRNFQGTIIQIGLSGNKGPDRECLAAPNTMQNILILRRKRK